MLDASAMVAVLIQEPGHDVVERILESGRAATTPLAMTEALNVCRRKGHPLDNAKLRGILAKDEMQWDPDVMDSILRNQVYASKEASSGGAGAAGGGCGCN